MAITWEVLLQLLWAVVPGIITGIIMAFWNRRQKEREQKEEQREAEQLKSELVKVSLLVSTAQLSYAVAMAKKRGYPNGEIEDGIEQYNKAMAKFREFEREQIAKGAVESWT